MVFTLGDSPRTSEQSISSGIMGPSPTTTALHPTESGGAVEGKGCGRGTPQGQGQGRGQQGGGKQGRGAGAGTNLFFKGHTMELGGHIFQVFHESNNRNQFAWMIEALGEYFAKNMKYAVDIMPLARDLKNPEVSEPTAIAKTEMDRQVIFKWEKEMTDYITQKKHFGKQPQGCLHHYKGAVQRGSSCKGQVHNRLCHKQCELRLRVAHKDRTRSDAAFQWTMKDPSIYQQCSWCISCVSSGTGCIFGHILG